MPGFFWGKGIHWIWWKWWRLKSRIHWLLRLFETQIVVMGGCLFEPLKKPERSWEKLKKATAEAEANIWTADKSWLKADDADIRVGVFIWTTEKGGKHGRHGKRQKQEKHSQQIQQMKQKEAGQAFLLSYPPPAVLSCVPAWQHTRSQPVIPAIPHRRERPESECNVSQKPVPAFYPLPLYPYPFFQKNLTLPSIIHIFRLLFMGWWGSPPNKMPICPACAIIISSEDSLESSQLSSWTCFRTHCL